MANQLLTNIFSTITQTVEQINAAFTEDTTTGIIYFNNANRYRLIPIENSNKKILQMYYPKYDAWYTIDDANEPIISSISNNDIADSIDTTDYLNSGGAGTSPNSKMEAAITIALAIANDNSYGYNMSGGNPAPPYYNGRIGGWYAFIDNQTLPDNQKVQGDFDCSSFVTFCLLQSNALGYNANYDLFKTWNTTSMYNNLERYGFIRLTMNSNLKLLRGDILFRTASFKGLGAHTAFYIGDNQIVHARSNDFSDLGEAAKIPPGYNQYEWQKLFKRKGDYLGLEICTTPIYTPNWQYVYRLPKD